MKKTEEFITDFGRKPKTIPELGINGKEMKKVLEYKYLGTVLDHDLTFDTNITAIQGKCQSRIYFLQKLRSLGVSQLVLGNFYRRFIQSVLTFGFLNWFGHFTLHRNRNVNKTVSVCGGGGGGIVGVRQMSESTLYKRQVRRKAKIIAMDPGHVLPWLHSAARLLRSEV